MSVEVAVDSPLALSLNSAIQPKLIEVGWSTGGADDSALSEYIILMLVNGKTQDQIAAELSGDLLNLGPDDPGARDFSQWLFQQVEILSSQQNNGDSTFPATAQEHTVLEGQDADMGDYAEAGEANVPTGPKSMRTGGGNKPRDRRMLGHLARAMDRSNESVLHRVRPQGGNERINTHSRGPPTGPRQQPLGRGVPRMQNGRNNGGLGGMQVLGNATANVMNMNPQQQQQLYAMLEQQANLMAQMLGTQQITPAMGRGNQINSFNQHQNGRSLFDRVQHNGPRSQNQSFRNGPPHGRYGEHQKPSQSPPSSSMDVDMSQEKPNNPSPDTICPFQLSCYKKDCPMAHQSPAAPPGTTIDITDTCSFGAACKNHKCTGRHPSPAQKLAHQTETDCKYYPNCMNGADCPFRHPTMPPCRNGADCTTPNCKFTHSKVMCKFNPCTRSNCIFKHAEGQRRGKYEDKVWTATGTKEHVSERKFVDEDGEEELIKPEPGLSEDSIDQATLIT